MNQEDKLRSIVNELAYNDMHPEYAIRQINELIKPGVCKDCVKLNKCQNVLKLNKEHQGCFGCPMFESK